MNGTESSAGASKVALMFPGQGSQFEKMGRQFLRFNNKYIEYFDRASKVIGTDLLKIVNGEDENNSLGDTQFSQISIYSLSCSLFDYITDDLSIRPQSIDTVLGHSLGEYSALYGCGAYDFEEGAKLVAYRGKIMSTADRAARGMMAAVLGTEAILIEEILKDYKDKVFIANHNDYTQIVISGYAVEVKKAMLDLKEKGIKKVIPLKANIASHCPVMSEASSRLGDYIGEHVQFNDPDIPFLSTTEVSYRQGEDLRSTLTGQLVNSIRWVDSVNLLLDKGIDTFIEVGPGKVLSGLVARIARKNEKDITIISSSELDDIENLINKLQEKGLLDEA